MKILIIEDEPASLKLSRLDPPRAHSGKLRSDGSRGRRQGEEILRFEPEAILLDLELFGIDGLTLARDLKRDPNTQHIASAG
jgi:CheY-like chemotaxis protein